MNGTMPIPAISRLIGCTLEDRCLIGINATILNRSVVKTGSIVAAGSVVREGQVVGPYALVAGVPAEVKRELDEGVDGMLSESTGDYLELAEGQGAVSQFDVTDDF